MKYYIKLNDAKRRSQYDYEVRWDGTLATYKTVPKDATELNIMVYTEGEQVSHRQYFALFCLIMLIHKGITEPEVNGDVTWSAIVDGAK